MDRTLIEFATLQMIEIVNGHGMEECVIVHLIEIQNGHDIDIVCYIGIDKNCVSAGH